MKIAVVGAGIVGITSAYELARDGHAVTVYERRGAAAEEASFANAGVLAPGYVTPWAAPGMPWKVLRQMMGAHSAFRLAMPLSGADMAWLWHFWRACKLDTYLSHRAALQKLAFYSRAQLQGITERHSFEYDRAEGYLIALRSEKDRAMVQNSLKVLRDLGVPFAELDEAAARDIEPAINTDTHFVGAIHLPNDEVANCRQFALLLKDECRRMGVQFEFNVSVQKVTPAVIKTAQGATVFIANIDSTSNSQLSSLLPPARPQVSQVQFDAVVLCTGVQAAPLLRPMGLHLPLRPVYGYAVSAPVKEPLNAPRSGLMDEHYKVSITRLGQRVRVAGGAQVGGRSGEMNRAAIKTLYKVLHDWFPGAAVMSQGVQEWQGARPMLANRAPIISAAASALPGIWLNLGHGSSGWALSCGSARLLADQIAGRSAQIDTAPFALGSISAL
jgi:D-amino-acid dehydrogenase